MPHSNAARFRTGGVLLISTVLTVGCALTMRNDELLPDPSRFSEPVELTAVPFFPQADHYCGPSALAMVLAWSGAAVTPQSLVPQMYLPSREGTLQLELIATARRYGRIPYVIDPQLESVLREIAAGNPVIVLQNLGLAWIPQWHYAVAVGYNLADSEIILHSGPEARHTVSLTLFDRTWRRSGRWAVVVSPPDRLPATAQELRYVQAVAPLEQIKMWRDAVAAYGTALRRWPKSLPARMGQGNSYYALDDLVDAEASFRLAIHEHPNAAPAYNNLAQTLADRQRWDEAQEAARKAVALGGPLVATYQGTLERILRHAAGAEGARIN